MTGEGACVPNEPGTGGLLIHEISAGVGQHEVIKFNCWISQVTALARKKKGCNCTLKGRWLGICQWWHSWSSTAWRNLRFCTLQQKLLFSFSFSPRCDPFFPCVMSWLLILLLFSHFSQQWCALVFSSLVWNQIALYTQPQLPSVCGCRVRACLCVFDSCQEASKTKPPQSNFWLFWFVFVPLCAC